MKAPRALALVAGLILVGCRTPVPALYTPLPEADTRASQLLARFEEDGFEPWMDEWNALDAFAGAEVILHSGSRQMAGVARGVDGRGALQLETATTGVQSVFGGEISLRPAQ